VKNITKFWQGRWQQLPRTIVVLGVGLALGMTVWAVRAGEPSADAPNSPMGIGKGIFPGRVVWARDPAATPWDGVTGHWWDDTATDQKVVDQMTAHSLRSLTGGNTDTESWDRLFKYFNRTHDRGDTGYRPTEGIAIKINCNNAYDGYGDVDQQIDASKQTVLALLRQLVNQAGVPQDKIVVYEAIRVIPDRIYIPCHAEFPGVLWMDSQGDGKNGRQPVNWRTNSLTYSAKTVSGTSIPQLVHDATYIINLAVLKGHHSLGISLTAKNHYGSIKEDRQHWWADKAYTPLVDLIGSKHLGGKTVLFMIDGLYGIKDVNDNVEAASAHWTNLFNGQWCASLFMSQDPVAIDSVGYDFLRSEFGSRLATDAKNNGNGFAMDAYLREAALADHPPSGTIYQPDGTRLASLGTHEHWNDATRKQYSRNLGTNGTGIELVSLLASNATVPANKDGVFNVKDFGATGDGKTLDTDAINQAIIAANATGGGTVRFPAGTYLAASIRLRSNVTLQLEAGSTIEAVSEKLAPYDPPETNAWTRYQDFGHSHWHNSLIWGENIENVSIIGPGLIHGKGLQNGLYGKIYRDTPPNSGNKAISLVDCRNVILRDFSILHGGWFAILATGVDNLTIDNIKLDTNRDGMDIDCCHNVRISNCSVNSPWDDGICLKSSYALGCLRATENVTINNCYVTGGYIEGTLLDGTFQRAPAGYAGRTGRIKFGTESNGGFKNIAISNCIFDDCGGVAIESVDGGDIEDVTINNISMRNIVNSPIFIRLGNRARGPNHPPVGVIRRINISDLVVSGASQKLGSIISGIPGHPVEDVLISNVHFLQEGGGTAAEAKLKPPENEAAYPEPGMFGAMPSYGFFIRHAKGMEFSDVTLRTAKEDLRPAFILEDVDGANFQNVQWHPVAKVPSFVLTNVLDFNLCQSPPLPDKKLGRVKQKQF
jgi:polygalacturonase